MTVDAGYFVSLVTWVNVASVTFPSQFFVLNQFLLFSSLEFFVSERIKILKANNSSKGGKSSIPRKICQSANLSDCEILSRRFRSFLSTASPVGSVGWKKTSLDNKTQSSRSNSCLSSLLRRCCRRPTKCVPWLAFVASNASWLLGSPELFLLEDSFIHPDLSRRLHPHLKNFR